MQKLNKLLLVLALCLQASLLQAQITVLDESMLTAASFNTFTTVNVSGAQAWNQHNNYGAICSGYSQGQSFENEDWLISPAMNLSDMENARLTFSHTRGSAAVMNVGVAQGWQCRPKRNLGN